MPTEQLADRKKQQDQEELSEEDIQLRDKLLLLVERIKDVEPEVQRMAIDALATEIRSSTSSMTSVPKPLKFLKAEYEGLKQQFDRMSPDSKNRTILADVISVLAMTSAPEESRETLKYKLLAGDLDVSLWGHEYIRRLCGEISSEYAEKNLESYEKDNLMKLVSGIVPWNMTHNAEPEAVDLCVEVERLDILISAIDENNCDRACLYLLAISSYLPEPDNSLVLQAAYDAYCKVKRWTDALRVALRLGDSNLATDILLKSDDVLEQKQLSFMLGEAKVWVDLEKFEMLDSEVRAQLASNIGNNHLSERYLALARDLDVMEARLPEDVYKMHLVEGRSVGGPSMDSARANLAATFVNGFINAGFGHDKLVTAPDEDPSQEAPGSVHWIFRNKDHAKMSAAASLGLVLLWDIEGGLPQIDRFLYASDSHVVAGALLGVGIIASGVVDEVDPALAILSEYISREEVNIRCGAIVGLGIAYAGRSKTEVSDLLLPLVLDVELSMDVAAQAAIAIGLSFVGTAQGDAVESILQALMMRSESDLASPNGRLMCLALGLLFIGRQEEVEATLEVARTLPERISTALQTILDVCAYAATGDVLKIQKLLAVCGEHIEVEESEEWKASHQIIAALGVALVACGEDIGRQMANRALEHMLQYGDKTVRRGIPLALALLYVSNPEVTVTDTLTRLSHDVDAEVAMNAVLALGIVGAGTNNARLAATLRSLSAYYFKDPTLLYLVRISQGLLHAGKGLLTMDPHFSDGAVLSRPAMAGILVILISCMDIKNTLAGKDHYLLYCLVPALRPRMLITLDENGEMLPVPVRVGKAVDVVAQAGRPKSITGFQTHTTPVLLAAGDRAELGTEKYIPLSSVLEGSVILKRNPEYVDVD